ncbi:hypothetical protein D9M68_857070 [compost metagenome]
MQLSPENRLLGLREVDGLPRYRVVMLDHQRWAIVEEDAIEVPSMGLTASFRTLLAVLPNRTSQVGSRPSMNQVGSTLRVICIVWLDLTEAFDEVRTIDKDRCWHSLPPDSKTPKGSARPGWDGRLTAMGEMPRRLVRWADLVKYRVH